MSKKVIELVEYTEDFRDYSELVKESVDGKETYFLEGCYGQLEKWNLNNRWYQKKEGEMIVEDYNKNRIPKRDKIFGELDHSKESSPQFHRMALIFENPLQIVNNDIVTKARVLESTTYGRTLKVVLDEKLKFGASTKGLGSLSKVTKKGKRGNLVSNWVLKNVADIVVDQSAQGALPKVIIEMLMENDRRIYDIFNYELIEEVRKNMRSVMSYEIEEKIDENFSKLLNFNIKNK